MSKNLGNNTIPAKREAGRTEEPTRVAEGTEGFTRGGTVQDNSLLQMPPWSNPWLLVAMALSFGLHFVILYVPPLADIFSIVPLNFNEWLLVILFAAPVILIDEALKFVGRHFVNPPTSQEQLRKLKSQ